MANNFNTANTEGIDFNTTYTSYIQSNAVSATNSPDNPGPPVSVGTTVKGTNDSDYVFVLASSAIALGDVVLISPAYAAASITTTTATAGKGSLVGVAANVAIASGAYGWVQRAGTCSTGIRVVGATAPFVTLAATATPGVLDDVVTTGTVNITGVVITVTSAAATAATAGILNYPVVGSVN